jgi:alkanesulfonate monooxygenase SsuD/methylene tetrahydromethanopterin reductase-like flavin-dependent oxidoreductase (luciferase family)
MNARLQTPPLTFGIFDHLDQADEEVTDLFDSRLRLLEAYDAAGFYAYHLAEHHSTPLGLASSPCVFLAAAAQRTNRIRLGPLVMTLNLYHPLRAFEEICMLDRLSHGRAEFGLGRGVSPIELSFFGIQPEMAQARYKEASEIILSAMAGNQLTYRGEYFAIENAPIFLTPVQRPHPPLWYGVASPDTAVWAADRSINIVCNGNVASVRKITDAFRTRRAVNTDRQTSPVYFGMNRHVVIAETEKDAREIATPAYRKWYDSLTHLWRMKGIPIPINFPATLVDAIEAGYALIGTTSTVRDLLYAQVRDAGVNYVLCRLAFGTLPLEVSLATVGAIQREIMPVFAR